MAQKDYVGRGRSPGTQRKKNAPKRKNSKSTAGISKLLVAVAVAAVVIFIGILWFIAHHKPESSPAELPHSKNASNGLPPKPEERWKYIKELENRQITVPTPTEPSASGVVKSPLQLTEEQKQLLAQMAADMQQQPTPLNEVPWNEQTPAQQQQTLRQQQYKNQLNQQHQLELQQSQKAQQEREQQLKRQQQLSVQQKPSSSATAGSAPGHQTQTTHTPAPISAAKQDKPANGATGKRWQIQCGSFKGADQSESTRAALAFEGFESRVIAGNGWNRVVIGPYSQRSRVDEVVKHLRSNGHTNCITLTVAG